MITDCWLYIIGYRLLAIDCVLVIIKSSFCRVLYIIHYRCVPISMGCRLHSMLCDIIYGLLVLICYMGPAWGWLGWLTWLTWGWLGDHIDCNLKGIVF